MKYDLVIRKGTVLDGGGNAPFEADIGVTDGCIAGVGHITDSGHEEIDAAGKLITPGFVDIHTHFDGQAMWSNRMTPSSQHGVTTVVVGNCGVGFAPCRREDRERLIELMEGVEDMPGTVIAEGLPWNWETFPEYLNAIDAQPHDIDIAACLPHSALRVYVMGKRAVAGEIATPGDVAKMAKLTHEAILAGAMGFSSSRTLAHKSCTGELVPSFDAGEQELTAIAMAMKAAGRGVLQLAADFKTWTDLDGEIGLLKRVAKVSGRSVAFPIVQANSHPEVWREILRQVEQANAEGLDFKAQAMPRGIGIVVGLELSTHAFSSCPTYMAMAHLPLVEQVARMRDPVVRAKLLGEKPGDPSSLLFGFGRKFDSMFKLGDPPDYEQPPEKSLAAEARRRGIPPEELIYDLLLEDGGKSLFYVPAANYSYGNLDAAYTMMQHKDVVLALGDAGAHCGLMCDASYTTYLLSHWTRDRKRGGKISVPQAVKALTSDTASSIGLNDRGIIAPGYRADLNVIDYDRLILRAPRVVHDLPAKGRRVMQDADGFVATIVAGTVTYRNGEAMGPLPGRLIRGAQPKPTL